jgi:hypothetical protein
MFLKGKQRLLLGLTVSLAVVVTLPPAAASAVSTLMGEALNGSSSQGNTFICQPAAYSVNGSATGPYPGTFTEAGTWTQVPETFSATFTITSGTTTITGSRFGPPFSGFHTTQCGTSEVSIGGHVAYTATIHTPTGNFHDEGTSFLVATIAASGEATVTGAFHTSSLPEAILIGPNSRDQCKNNGWKAFPQFKNQGQCVSFVERQPQT